MCVCVEKNKKVYTYMMYIYIYINNYMYNQYVIPPWLLLYAPYYLAFHSTLWRGADQELHQPGIEAETQSFVDLWDSCGCDKSDI